jgi:hypothetical protein
LLLRLLLFLWLRLGLARRGSFYDVGRLLTPHRRRLGGH